MTRETAASSGGPGHDRPERARACLLAGQAETLIPVGNPRHERRKTRLPDS